MRSSRTLASGLWFFARFLRDEPTRFASISIRSAILFWATKCTGKIPAAMAGRCCTRGVSDFFIRSQKIGWNSKPDYQTIFCRVALKKTGLYEPELSWQNRRSVLRLESLCVLLAKYLSILKAKEKLGLTPLFLLQEMTRSRLKFGIPTDHPRFGVDVPIR